MLKLKNILIIVLIVLTLGIAWYYYRKLKDTDKLKLGAISLYPTQNVQNFEDAVAVLQNGLRMEGFIEISNLSEHDYTLNQMSLDLLTPSSQKVIARQTNILQQDLVLKRKSVTPIPLTYHIDIPNALSLFKESGVIPADSTLWQVITHPSQWSTVDFKKLKIKLKGFIQAEGITLSIHKEIPLYE